MLVKANDRDKPVEVYGIYWVNNERIYWVIPYAGYEGFATLSECESTIIDPHIDEVFVMRKNDANKDLLLHWAADKNDLIYDLIEHDPEAMKEFKRRLSKINLATHS